MERASAFQFLDAVSQTELKDGILDLFDQIREANTRHAEKDSIIDSLTEKINTVLENQL